jgi:hypothetical protein
VITFELSLLGKQLNRSKKAMKKESTEISEHFTGHFQVKQQINIDFSLELLQSIDAECQLQKMSRQEWIKMVCAEKLREVQSSRIAKNV